MTIVTEHANMQVPEYETIHVYLPTAYSHISVWGLMSAALIGPVITLPTPFKKAKIPNVVNATVGSSLNSEPIFAHKTTYPPPQKPYSKENIMSGAKDLARPHKVKMEIAEMRGKTKANISTEIL